MTIFQSPPTSICVLRLSAIGDVCNTIPVVQAIQKEWPNCSITWICGKLEAQLINDLPNINVVIFDKKKGWRGYLELWSQLKDQRFDALLHMQYALRSSIATLGIKAKYKLGFDNKRSQDMQMLFTNLKVKSPTSLHVVDTLLAFGSALELPKEKASWNLSYSQQAGQWAKQQLSSDKTNLVVVPATSKAYKNWNAQGYADVIIDAQNKGFNVIIAGSPAPIEIDLAASIEEKLTQPVFNLVGKSSIKEMLALLDHADLVLAPDTGPTHMASAMNTPVVGLYAHYNPMRSGPYHYLDYVVSVYAEAVAEEHNKPIEMLPWRTRVQDESAMDRIKAPVVIAMIERIVKEQNIVIK
ncbi:glycosyltransferase family 9 protein [Vibrio sp. SS-MA-C1-2]|uniref:glycosyltransferase family 9 protein n=1 Tax=Vibrio sp. SS-MA-C1-2 TaxID=2908646 RepID=UPI001F38DE87|nr:glycosyltransferase family 9 protein [Vibrio sp. SS-MA-C1-2]UJF17998.1 glycosyltransferase family 9 protein [Vibrio sp. SS-MA-C1-2]